MKQTISISTETIIRTILIFLVLGFFFLIKNVLALFFVAIIMSAAFDPFIDYLQKKKIPRALSIIGVYVIFLTLVGGSFYLLSGPIADQIRDMSRDFPQYYQKINQGLDSMGKIDITDNQTVNNSLAFVTSSLSKATTGIFSFLVSLFGGLISFFIILVITFYLVVEEDGMKRFIRSLTPTRHQPYISQLINKMQVKMGYWLRGQLLLSVIIFFMVFIILSFAGVKYALILALTAGIFEIIPYLGPLISAIPAVFFAFAQSPSKALLVVVLYFIIQRVENDIIVPKVLGKSIGLNPLVVILAILIGARIGGAVGALLAVPVTTALSVYFDDLMSTKRKRETKLEA